jgi:hypothetical protein
MDEESATGAGWATVARETFEFSVIPWVGRPYANWMRAWSRPHPGDPRGLVQLPDRMYKAFQQRTTGQRLSRKTAEALGYPGVPGEQELERVRRELHDALGRSDWDEAHDLDIQLRDLQERVAAMRITALTTRAAVGA